MRVLATDGPQQVRHCIVTGLETGRARPPRLFQGSMEQNENPIPKNNHHDAVNRPAENNATACHNRRPGKNWKISKK